MKIIRIEKYEDKNLLINKGNLLDYLSGNGEVLSGGPPTTTTTTTTPAPELITVDIIANINVIDFKISKIDNPVLSTDFTELTLVYTGIANPVSTANVTLIDYEYSLDNGITWDTMTTESVITGLTFNVAGEDYNFVWKIKDDLVSSIYNIPIVIRFRAQAIFDSDIVLTTYKTKTINILKAITTPEPVGNPIFPDEYTGVPGSDILKNAPK